jgi:uncharacterized protein
VSTPHFLASALAQPADHGIHIERTGAVLVQRLEMAGDSRTRRKGLLGRDALDQEVGLVIAPTQGVHTFGMRFPIDIVGVARDGRVVKVRGDVPPRRLVFALRAFAILELAAGVARRAAISVGDRLIVVRNQHEADPPRVTR